MMPFIDILLDAMSVIGKIIKLMQPVFDFANLIGAGLGDLAGQVGALFGGDDKGFAASNKAGARFESNLGYEGYYTGLSKEGDGANLFANGGILKSRVDNITAGEAGPEAILPLPAKGISVDNSGMEKILSEINQGLQRQKPVPLYQITRS
jgi:hypothetical protein